MASCLEMETLPPVPALTICYEVLIRTKAVLFEPSASKTMSYICLERHLRYLNTAMEKKKKEIYSITLSVRGRRNTPARDRDRH